jgi:hypothetical protein
MEVTATYNFLDDAQCDFFQKLIDTAYDGVTILPGYTWTSDQPAVPAYTAFPFGPLDIYHMAIRPGSLVIPRPVNDIIGMSYKLELDFVEVSG